MHGQGDHLWQAIDDGDPRGLDLWRLQFRQESDCWRGADNHHPQPIDFLVFDDRAWRLVDQGSVTQVTDDAADQDEARRTPIGQGPSGAQGPAADICVQYRLAQRVAPHKFGMPKQRLGTILPSDGGAGRQLELL